MHAAELRSRIAEMQAMQRTLESLARTCHGDRRPDCLILLNALPSGAVVRRRAGCSRT
jgi:hypothetical protein